LIPIFVANIALPLLERRVLALPNQVRKPGPMGVVTAGTFLWSQTHMTGKKGLIFDIVAGSTQVRLGVVKHPGMRIVADRAVLVQRGHMGVFIRQGFPNLGVTSEAEALLTLDQV